MSPDEPPTDDRLLHGLSHELPPPAALEDRLVGELRRRGLLAHRTSSSGLWRLAASALVAFALGLWLGPKVVATAPASEASGRYLLLLYEPRPLDRAGVDLVAEYSAWAGDLARGGKLVVFSGRRCNDAFFTSTPFFSNAFCIELKSAKLV